MTALTMSPSAHNVIQVTNESNLSKIESFLNDTAYREAIENSSNYNSRLCRERRLRMPFLDSQTGVAQNHSALFMSARERLPGLLHGQIYTYPSKRWRKKRRQYLMHYLHPKRGPRGDVDDGPDGIEAITHINDDSKDSVALKDEHSKDAWYYDEQDMLDMDAYDEPDPESDYDYEESYSSKRKRRKPRGGGHHPARSHPPSTESPIGKRSKGGGRGRKKTNYDAVDSDKPFVCDRGTRRGRQNATSSSTSSPSPVATPSPAAGPTAPPAPASQQSQAPHHHPQQQQPPPQLHHPHHQQQQSSSQQLSPQHHSPQHQQQSQQQPPPPLPPPPGGGPGGPIQMPVVPPGSPTMIPVKEEHGTAAPSPGTAVPSPGGSLRSIEGGPSTPAGNEKRAGKSALPSPYCDFCLGDARENKKTGGSEELVSCSDCGRSGKPEEKNKRKYARRITYN